MLNLGSCLIWNIWKTRNDLVFNNNQIAAGSCIHKALEDFKYFDLHHALNFCSETQVNQNNIAVWELPPSTFVKINVDVTYNNGKGDVGAIAVDSFGNHQGCGAICFYTFYVVVAEAKAYGFGIQLANRLQLPRVIVEGDASDIPKAMTEIRMRSLGVFAQWFYLFVIASKILVKIRFATIPRDANSIAHDLVQYAISNSINK